MNGGNGRDSYYYNLGDGYDTITETRGNDKIIFGEGISINNLSFRQDGSNLDILINNDVSQGVTVKDFYSGTNYQVETLQFANGSTFNLSTQGITLQQTDADDTVKGTSYNDIITEMAVMTLSTPEKVMTQLLEVSAMIFLMEETAMIPIFTI